MALYSITGPDGTVYELEGPEGATREQVIAEIQRQNQQIQTPTQPVQPLDPATARTDQFAQAEEESGALNRFLKGAAAPVIQTGLGVYDLLGGDLSEEQRYALQATERDRGAAGLVGEIAGEAAMLAVPATKAYQGGRVLGQALRGTVPRRLAATAPLAVESALVGTAEALKAPTGDQTRTQAGLEGAAWNLGLGKAGELALGAAGRIARPRTFRKSLAAQREQRRLRSRGMDDFLPLTEALDTETAGVLARLSKAAQDKILTNFPATRPAIDRQKKESLDRWWDTVIQDTLPPNAALQTPQGAQPIRNISARTLSDSPAWDTMADVMQFYHKQEYPRLLNKHRFSQRNIAAHLYQLTSKSKVKKQIDALIEDVAENGIVSGGDLKTSIQTTLKSMARSARTGKKPNIPRAREYESMVDLIEDGLMTRIRQAGPDDLRDYEALKEPYANYLVVNDAFGRKPQAGADPEPIDLARRAMNKKGQARSVAGRGAAPLQRAAARSAKVREKIPKSDDIYRIGAAWGMAGAPIIGGLTGGTAGALAATTIPAYMYGLSRPGFQKYLMGDLPLQRWGSLQQARARQQAEALRRLIGIRPGTAVRAGVSSQFNEED